MIIWFEVELNEMLEGVINYIINLIVTKRLQYCL